MRVAGVWSWRARRYGAAAAALSMSIVVVTTTSAYARGESEGDREGKVIEVITDPYDSPTSQHRTAVEPDSFSYGSTIVTAAQVGRFADSGSANIGWATSTDGGRTWTNGALPGITTVAGGLHDRVSDPSVAYDAAHGVWLISSLAMLVSDMHEVRARVVVSRSTDGGLTWEVPRMVHAAFGADKNWTACDNTPASPFLGRCYTQWDDVTNGFVFMATSVDGGLTWGPPRYPADEAGGLGGQPLVQPSGRVVVPILTGHGIGSFISDDGGATWSAPVPIASMFTHWSRSGLRLFPLPSAEIDGAGVVYVAWPDCRFVPSCTANDIVLSTSADGITWTQPARVPIERRPSGVDHFLPGLGVDTTTAGDKAKLGLAYYYYPASDCAASDCALSVGFISSADGGAHWTEPVRLAGPMSLDWLPFAGGRMVGDYISTSFAEGRAHPFFSVARAPTDGRFDQVIATARIAVKGSRMEGACACGSPPPDRHRSPSRCDRRPDRNGACQPPPRWGDDG